MAKRRKKKRVFNMAGYIAIFAVVITIAVVTWIRGLSLQEKIDSYDAREEELTQLIAEEEARTQELEERKKYIQTKQYIEEIAKEKFGLVYPDEVVIKKSNKK
ncbi:MAG: septum formation initiator family protein [Thermoflexaceae bacterium]|nr:septum formation initiator family protein [Thermoflexaceae bacterium]